MPSGLGLVEGLLTHAIAARSEAPVQPYAINDAGGSHSMLPSGEHGLDNVGQLAEFKLNGTYPAHFMDQSPLYAD